MQNWARCAAAGVVLAVALAGCNNVVNRPEPDARMSEKITDNQVVNAIITQHSIYPYHFVPDSAVLNELGKRELGILAAHMKEHPGAINVGRGDGAGDDLYNARLKAVHDGLVEAGVDASRVKIADGLPGGSGMSSDRIVTIVRTEKEAQESRSGGGSATYTSPGGSGTGGTGMDSK